MQTDQDRTTAYAPGYIDRNYYVATLGAHDAYPALSSATTADVCVVGGGLAGINTALGLVQRGKSVVLLEGKRIGWGASGRNAGFVAKGYAADDGSILKRLGPEHAKKLVTLTQNARKLIRERIAEFNIDCGPVIDGVLTVSWRDNPDVMKAYAEKSNALFDQGFEFWPTEKVREHCKTDKYYGGIFSPRDFQFHPLRYLHGLAKAVTAKGGRIFENSPAVAIEKDGNHWLIRTKEGAVRAQQVVVCCATYVGGLNQRLANASFPVQTYIMVTQPFSDTDLAQSINTRHAISDMRFCSDYYRRLDGNRVLWGGRVALSSKPRDVAAMMTQDMLRVYPQLAGKIYPEFSWAGELAYAPHKMPQLGEIEPGYWYNTGFGGHGLAPTTVGGEMVAKAIAEKDDTYKQFAPFGIGFAGGRAGRYVAQLVYWWWRARDYISVA